VGIICRQTRLVSRSRLHSGQVISAVFRPVKTIVQRESRHWMHSMNGHLPLRADRDLLLWRGTITSANANYYKIAVDPKGLRDSPRPIRASASIDPASELESRADKAVRLRRQYRPGSYTQPTRIVAPRPRSCDLSAGSSARWMPAGKLCVPLIRRPGNNGEVNVSRNLIVPRATS
jgi:hypothetical protein